MWFQMIYGKFKLNHDLFTVINQEWQFEIPFVGIIYKPWRLFFVICSLPGKIKLILSGPCNGSMAFLFRIIGDPSGLLVIHI